MPNFNKQTERVPGTRSTAMRWKLLLLLFCAVSLISLSTSAAAEEHEQEQDDATDDDYDAVAAENEEQTEPEEQTDPSDEPEDTDQKTNEDVIDVDTDAVDEGKDKKGRYYNYADFLSELDMSDSNYNWEGKLDQFFWFFFYYLEKDESSHLLYAHGIRLNLLAVA